MGDAHRQRVENLEPGAAAIAHRAQVHLSAIHIGSDIVHETRDADSGIACGEFRHGWRRTRADDGEPRLGDDRRQSGPDLLDHEQHRIAVREPVHPADHQDVPWFSCAAAGAEVVHVNPIRDHGRRDAGANLAEPLGIQLGDHEMRVERCRDIGLVAPELGRLETEIEPLQKVAFVADAAVEQVRLDVVMVERDGGLCDEVTITGKADRVEVNHVEWTNLQRTDQGIAQHRRRRPVDGERRPREEAREDDPQEPGAGLLDRQPHGIHARADLLELSYG